MDMGGHVVDGFVSGYDEFFPELNFLKTRDSRFFRGLRSRADYCHYYLLLTAVKGTQGVCVCVCTAFTCAMQLKYSFQYQKLPFSSHLGIC